MIKRKIAITDFREEGYESEKIAFSAAGAEVVICECNTLEELAEKARDAEVLVFTCSKITEELITGLPSCRMLIRYGIGLDNVDIAAATRRGIYVCNTPSYGSFAVAEHAFALLLALNRKIIQLDSNVRNGKWGIDSIVPVHTLQNKVLGVIGFGNAGRLVSRMARAFDMKVLVCDPLASQNSIVEQNCLPVDFDELESSSDHISLHAPLNDKTRHMFDRDVFRKMKTSSTIINTGRGALIKESDLVDALETGLIAGAALDVFEDEPLKTDSRLPGLKNVVLSPHVAWYTEESIANLHKELIDEVLRFLKGELPLNITNRKHLSL